jgi:hypothetical protein
MDVTRLFVTKETGKTGRYRYRRGWFGKVILQIEVGIHRHPIGIDSKTLYPVETKWRDARQEEVGLFHPHAHAGMQYQDYTTHFFMRITAAGVMAVGEERDERAAITERK